MRATIKRKLYMSTEEETRWEGEATIRGLIQAKKELEIESEYSEAKFGNIGMGQIWLEVDGIPIIDPCMNGPQPLSVAEARAILKEVETI